MRPPCPPATPKPFEPGDDVTGPESTPQPHNLRKPCTSCSSMHGTVHRVGLQDVVRCTCGTFQYNAPRTETGAKVVSLSDRNGLTPGQRKRILARYGHACYICGARPPEARLEVDHIIDRKSARNAGLLDELIDSEDNYAPACTRCNSGKRAEMDITLVIRALTIRHRMERDLA